MQCLRCNAEMKHYDFQSKFTIAGSVNKPNLFSSTTEQHYYNPQSVYICNECGYVEFSMRPCENPDV